VDVGTAEQMEVLNINIKICESVAALAGNVIQSCVQEGAYPIF
jgi:hypothetical protein